MLLELSLLSLDLDIILVDCVDYVDCGSRTRCFQTTLCISVSAMAFKADGETVGGAKFVNQISTLEQICTFTIEISKPVHNDINHASLGEEVSLFISL